MCWSVIQFKKSEKHMRSFNVFNSTASKNSGAIRNIFDRVLLWNVAMAFFSEASQLFTFSNLEINTAKATQYVVRRSKLKNNCKFLAISNSLPLFTVQTIYNLNRKFKSDPKKIRLVGFQFKYITFLRFTNNAKPLKISL